jgi:hypothetical protein
MATVVVIMVVDLLAAVVVHIMVSFPLFSFNPLHCIASSLEYVWWCLIHVLGGPHHGGGPPHHHHGGGGPPPPGPGYHHHPPPPPRDRCYCW